MAGAAGGTRGDTIGPARRDNLPAPLTSFIGREREVAELVRLLEANRLVTLAGAPGVGKTRLALRVAAEARDRFPDGVWLVELAGLAEPTLVPSAVAAALGVREGGGRPLPEALADRLRSQPVLLTLDNCEHVLDACAALVHALLQACPFLRVLATSREPLGLIGEVIWRVPSLTLPAIDAGTGGPPDGAGRPGHELLDALLRSEAGQLFVERAAAVRPGFVATEANAPEVAQVCALLDGIPLAIELAAARVLALAPAQIAARLDDRFALLTGGSRTALARQRTLRAMVDWSHELLSESERVLLRRLSVFAGGWTLEAAESVASGHPVLDLMTGLVDKSLVLAEEWDGEVRYRMLEMIRQYAADRLREAGERDALGERHRDWFVAFAERATAYLRRPEQAVWRARLEREHDNVRAALRWTIERGEAEPHGSAGAPAADAGLRLGVALWHFWIDHGYSAEGRAWLERLLALDTGSGRTAIRAAGLFVAAKLAFDGADVAAALLLAEESLTIAHEVGDPHTVHRTLTQLGHIARGRGEWAAARRYYEEALPIRRELAEPVDVAVSLACLGHVARAQGDYDAAQALYEESLALSLKQGHPAEITAALHDLGRLAHQRGRYDEASAYYAEALPIAHRINHPRRTAYLLEGFAALAAARGQAERAQRLAGAAAALRRTSGSILPPSEHAALDHGLAPARRMLGEGRGAALWAAGGALPAKQAVALALSPALAAPAPAAPDRSDPLTRREREIAGLVARGLSNRQMADELVVSERTVEWHVANLLGKLGLGSRAQLAVWAAEHGLAPTQPE